MKEQPLVSITMSTYNVEAFIKESLDCIVNQTLKNIEIICIDDGSTDTTLAILNDYATKDKRIKVVAKNENEGLAVARNEALALATGKYISFIDGDDLMDVDLFRKAFELAEKTNAEMVLWDYAVFYNKKDLEINKKEASKLSEIDTTDKVALLQRPAFTWVKLIKTAVARKLLISFPKGLTRQDIPVHWQLITQINAIALLPERLSYYRQQPQATTHKADERLFDLAIIMDITKAYLKQNNLYETYKNEFLRQQLNLLSGMEDVIDASLKEKAMQLIYERLSDDQWNYIHSNNPLRRQARDFYLSLQGVFIAKIRRKVWLLSRSVYRMLNRG